MCKILMLKFSGLLLAHADHISNPSFPRQALFPTKAYHSHLGSVARRHEGLTPLDGCYLHCSMALPATIRVLRP